MSNIPDFFWEKLAATKEHLNWAFRKYSTQIIASRKDGIENEYGYDCAMTAVYGCPFKDRENKSFYLDVIKANDAFGGVLNNPDVLENRKKMLEVLGLSEND